MLLLSKGALDMPVLESTDRVAPRSIVRRRPLEDPKKRSVVTTAAHPLVQRASRVRPQPADDDLISEWKRGDVEEEDYASVPPRKTNPPVRRVATVPQQVSVTPEYRETNEHSQSSFRAHPLLLLGLGMMAMLVLWMLASAGINWWNNTMNDIHYGYPRIYQTDATVGHNDSVNSPSHFIATNLHGKIEVIEFPGGDGSHARIYLGPQLFGPDADKAPATLKFIDINGDSRPDMLIFFQSSWIVFINDQRSFRPPTALERQEAAQYITTHGLS
jgi:hypothetical protein